MSKLKNKVAGFEFIYINNINDIIKNIKNFINKVIKKINNFFLFLSISISKSFSLVYICIRYKRVFELGL